MGSSVLSLSIEKWDHVWRSRHHVMSRLGRHHKVLFASLPPDLAESRSMLTGGHTGGLRSTPIADHLREYVPSPWLPVNYRSPRADGLVEALRRRRLRREMSRLGMTDPILYIWHPRFVDCVGSFGESLVVFHCYDEYSAFNASDAERERIRQQEERLARRADLVIAASESLADARRQLNPHVHVVENGVDYDLFAQAQRADLQVPPALAALPGPIIGCVLTQLTVVDVPMLVELLRQRPQWQVVVIGMDRPQSGDQGAALDALLAMPNLHFAGRQKLAAMPAFLKGCDVCAIPWVINDITAASSSPLKLYEYFAAGKPIVSAALPLLKHLSGLVAFATGAQQWVKAIEQALAGDGPALVAQRQRLARENTWDQRVASIETAMVEALQRKRCPPTVHG